MRREKGEGRMGREREGKRGRERGRGREGERGGREGCRDTTLMYSFVNILVVWQKQSNPEHQASSAQGKDSYSLYMYMYVCCLCYTYYSTCYNVYVHTSISIMVTMFCLVLRKWISSILLLCLVLSPFHYYIGHHNTLCVCVGGGGGCIIPFSVLLFCIIIIINVIHVVCI